MGGRARRDVPTRLGGSCCVAQGADPRRVAVQFDPIGVGDGSRQMRAFVGRQPRAPSGNSHLGVEGGASLIAACHEVLDARHGNVTGAALRLVG